MHGRWRKYVEMKKSAMKAGEALVGMNSSGSQLDRLQSGYEDKEKGGGGEISYLPA